MTKSSVDRKRSRYGEKYSLRFHKQLKIYHLSCNDESPSLIAKFVETDGDLAMRLFELLENNYEEIKMLKYENQQLKQFIDTNITPSGEISEKVELIKQIAKLKEENNELKHIVFDCLKWRQYR